MARAQGRAVPGGGVMARFVVFADAMGGRERLFAVNADLVAQAISIMELNGGPATNLHFVGDQEIATVRGDLQTVVARLNGDSARSIDTVHLTGWVLDPNHPDRRYRLHPSILTNDEPPAWAPKPATDGGDQ